MQASHVNLIARELMVHDWQVKNTITLLEDDATIPFISRYRKEATGSLDEQQIASIKERWEELVALDKRRASILESIEEQGKLTAELKSAIERALTITELEDLYLPYKQKRKTRASVAREKGLEPLAKVVFDQKERDVTKIAATFLNEQVASVDDALQGARDIIAEWVSENVLARNGLRRVFENEAIISSKIVKGKEEEGAKYQDYFHFEEALKKCATHRLMAMMRGENEGVLRVSISPSEESSISLLNKHFIKGFGPVADQVKESVEDSYKRLLKPSIETEFYNISKEKADAEAIKVFADNLRQLLMSSPLGSKRTLALDPGFRSGCKLVCLDERGDLVHYEAIYPHPPQQEITKAGETVKFLAKKFQIEAIAIGNGTASRETEAFVRSLNLNSVQVFVVSEAGASVYSASETARQEFPSQDVTVRGAISIGRRLMDPLAELVKIDPKSIGVGQYQHDVDQTKLASSLNIVVESCVNQVGVELNTASKHLLSRVSGLGNSLAENIVAYRAQNGSFTSRQELLKVPRLGKKAFEQCAGFIRIRGAKNPLDNSAVHPESYPIVERMAKDLKCSVTDILNNEPLRKQISIQKYVSETVGLPTLTDIVAELAKPGRDPRSAIEEFSFDERLKTIEDLYEGMIVPGIVNNITNFGAFVDIGIKETGLVHISNIANKFISNPSDVLKMHQKVTVKVLEVDKQRKRIQLTMKGL